MSGGRGGCERKEARTVCNDDCAKSSLIKPALNNFIYLDLTIHLEDEATLRLCGGHLVPLATFA